MYLLQDPSPMHIVPVKFPNEQQTLSDVFHGLFQESESIVHCLTCAQNFNRRSKLDFLNVSDILILSVQRTVHDQEKKEDRKIMTPINVGGDLEVQLQNGQKHTFSLLNAIEHEGQNPRG